MLQGVLLSRRATLGHQNGEDGGEGWMTNGEPHQSLTYTQACAQALYNYRGPTLD